MHPDEVVKFEEVNLDKEIKINIFIEESGEIFPYRMSEYEVNKTFVNVLLVEGLTRENKKVYHYILISDPEIFLQKRYVNENKIFSYAKTIRCKKCLAVFTSPILRDDHETICINSKTFGLKFLKKGKKFSTENHGMVSHIFCVDLSTLNPYW